MPRLWSGSPLPLPHSLRGLLNASSHRGACASLLDETLATYTSSCYFFSSGFVIVFGIDFSFFLLFLRVPLGSPNLMPSFSQIPAAVGVMNTSRGAPLLPTLGTQRVKGAASAPEVLGSMLLLVCLSVLISCVFCLFSYLSIY